MRITIIAAAVMLVVGISALMPAPSPAQTAEAPAPRCIQVNRITNHTAISDREILFYLGPSRVWKNTLRADCPGLRFENAFAWEVQGGEVCANTQTIYVLNRGTPCQLGEFSRYTPPPPAARS